MFHSTADRYQYLFILRPRNVRDTCLYREDNGSIIYQLSSCVIFVFLFYTTTIMLQLWAKCNITLAGSYRFQHRIFTLLFFFLLIDRYLEILRMGRKKLKTRGSLSLWENIKPLNFNSKLEKGEDLLMTLCVNIYLPSGVFRYQRVFKYWPVKI